MRCEHDSRKILKIIPILILTILSLTILPISTAQEDPQFIYLLGFDDYSKKVEPGGSTTYTWTVRNQESETSVSYDILVEVDNPNNRWGAVVNPNNIIDLQPLEAEAINLTVTAPSDINKGSITITVIFYIYENGAEIQREEREAEAYLTAPEEEKKVFYWFDNPLPEWGDNIWGTFLLTVGIWFLLSLIITIILDPFVKAFTKKTKTELDDIVLRIVRTPFLILLFFFGVVSSMKLLEDHIPSFLIDGANSLYGIIFWLIVMYVAYKLFKDILVYYGRVLSEKTDSQIDDVLVPVVEKIGVVIIALVAFGYIMGYLNVDLTMFVAGGVVISMVIAFAAQETLSNFFSGIFILTDRPFKEGDTIILPDSDWYEVRKIGLRSTRLFRYKDSCLITLPNNSLANEKIINYSNPDDKCRIRKTIGVAYGSDPDKVRKILNDVFAENPHIIKDDEDMKPVIRFDELADSSINFFIQVIVDDRINKLDVVDYLNTEIYKRFEKEGIEIPFPQRVVHIKKE